MNTPTLSIIIVHYNVADFLKECLLSIQKFAKELNPEIIVVDNASPNREWKKLKEEFPDVRFIASNENLGFSQGNNLGVKHANGEYILLLNPDTKLIDSSILEVFAFAQTQKKLGCVGVRLVDKNGKFHQESKRSVPNIFNSFKKIFFHKNQKSKGYYRNDINEFEVAKIEVVTGAYLLCEKKKYLQIGGLDEAYFMYGEDIDLCYTFLQNGYENWYYGKSTILHYKGESTIKDAVYLERFYGAMSIFAKKYYFPKKPLLYFAIIFGIRTKIFFEKLKLKEKRLKI